MTTIPKLRTIILATLCSIGAALLIVIPGWHISATSSKQARNRILNIYDIRMMGGKSLANLLQGEAAALPKTRAKIASLRGSADELRARIPNVDVKMSPLTGAAEVVSSRTGALTGEDPRPGWDIVRDFLRANARVYGIDSSEVDSLHFIGESKSPSGLRMVRFEQMSNGLPVFQSETRAILDRNGRLIRTLGLMASGAPDAAPPGGIIPAEQALSSALNSVGLSIDPGVMSSRRESKGSRKMLITAADPRIAMEVTSKLVYFPIAPGLMIPAYSQITLTRTDRDWYTLVDAKTGTVLWRKNIRSDASTQDARFRVYVQADGTTPSDSPAPLSPTTATPGSGFQAPAISPTIVSMLTAMSSTASPNGWIDDCPVGGCTANETQTIGNNVHAYMDITQGADANKPDTSAAGVLDGNGKPTGNPDTNSRNRDFLGTTPRDFETNFLPPPQGGVADAGQTCTGNGNNGTLAIDQFRRAVVTNLFYKDNWYHDQLYLLGFDEAAGNFQQTNFSGMGLGNDRVLAEVDDGSGTNNSNFATPPDGMSGRMQMYRFTGPTIDRDGSLDSEIVLHEATHGLSNRLIGNASGLGWNVGGGMGEGWSDFFALSLLNNTNTDNPDGEYAMAAYATYKLGGYTDNYLYGIRRFPYSTDNSVNPMTWADADQWTNNLSGGIVADPLGFNNNGALEVHNMGEIWCLTLWEVRSRIIHDPSGANNDVPTGNHTMLQLIVDALKMTPSDPTVIDARDAIIAADGATNSYANEESIWGGFADRGLGYGAAAPLSKLVALAATHMGIKESFSSPYLDINSITVDDSIGNNNSHIDPGEPVNLDINLINPWHNVTKGVTSATATLTCSTSGITVVTGTSTYGAIAAQGNATGTPLRIKADSSVTAGEALDFTLTVTSSLGTQAVPFTLRVGEPNGNGAPITYTKTETTPLAIPDARPNGVISTLTVTDDFEIADINFEVNSLSHTFVDDLLIGLKGPSGYGTDMIGLIGLNTADDGDGDNLVNFVVDDQATGDMISTSDSHSPGYTGSYLPVFNSPDFSDPIFFGRAPDPVGYLSRFNGTSTKGTWQVLVSDEEPGDTGALNSWSIIVTPVAYTVTPFTCPNPTLNCPANISVNNDPGQCTAVVTYTTPTAMSDCSTPGTVTCMPASGSTFPIGMTTVNCSVTDDQSHMGSCSFTVTVAGTVGPSISCPVNVIANTVNPGDSSVIVNYPTPSASSPCSSVSVVCVPASGTAFPKGVTTVTCTATDGNSLQNSCSFSVEVFDFVIADDAQGTLLRFDSVTGNYTFQDCRKNVTLSGHGTLSFLGCKVQLHDTGPNPKKPDRTVDALANTCTKVGTATISYSGKTYNLNDPNMSNDIGKCGGTPF